MIHDEIEERYKVERCRAWIQHKSLTKVALQFPDHLLPDSAQVTARLQARVGAGVRLYILGDTTYGQCCVDEIAAEHVSAEAVIHFGPTCLTATCRLPALWIFTRKSCDTSRLEETIRDKARDVSSPVVLLYDVEYDHILRDFSVDGISLVVGRLLWGRVLKKTFFIEVDLVVLFQSFLRMATAADIAKLETKAVAAEKLIELLRQQISQARTG